VTKTTLVNIYPFDLALLESVADGLDLRLPNRDAIETLARRLHAHYDEQQPGFFEGVIDAATAVGKTYAMAGALDYLAALGIRNFAVIAPGSTILAKTIDQFTVATARSLVDRMACQPVIVHSDNFNSPAMAAALEDPDAVKLFVFTVQALTKPTEKAGRKTHTFREGLGKGLYAHLQGLDDLIVFADEHHCYGGPKFSAAIRNLDPLAMVGFTATPDEKRLVKEGVPIIFRYPLAAAIADRLVKTPVIVGRKDDRTDERTQLLDGARLLEAKEKTLAGYCAELQTAPIHALMLVNCRDIDHADTTASFLRSPQFADGRYADAVLVVHSDAKHKEQALADLDDLDAPDSPYRIVVQVGMLKEGWDCKRVYVIVSLRASVSEVLTEQTLGRGLRLPFGHYVQERPLLNELDVVAHERYAELLRKSKTLTETFVDHRTWLADQAPIGARAAVQRPVVEAGGTDLAEMPEEGAVAGASGTVILSSTEDRLHAAEQQATAADIELQPLRDIPTIDIPIMEVHALPVEFSLKQVTDETPFRELGRKLAVDPDYTLKRTRLEASVSTDAITGARETSWRQAAAVDRVAATDVIDDVQAARDMVVKAVVESRYVPSRKGEIYQATRLLDAVVAGAGQMGGAILSSYRDRVVRGMLQLVVEAQRAVPPSAPTNVIVRGQPFAPRPRTSRAKTTSDRYGAFSKAVGYTGWTRGMYEQAWFHSKPERELANLLDDADQVALWIRLHLGDLPILWNGAQSTYNPDFLVLTTDGDLWIAEVKADNQMTVEEVVAKRKAALEWVNEVNGAESSAGERWHYLLIAERDLEAVKGDWAALANLTGT
jgi:type III restriction enzyme